MAVNVLATKGAKGKATLDDLYHVPENGKAEIVNGELVMMSPTGGAPSYAASEIFISLREYARRKKTGYAVADNAGFHVDLSNRESFSPDAAFYVGPHPGMKFFDPFLDRFLVFPGNFSIRDK